MNIGAVPAMGGSLGGLYSGIGGAAPAADSEATLASAANRDPVSGGSVASSNHIDQLSAGTAAALAVSMNAGALLQSDPSTGVVLSLSPTAVKLYGSSAPG